MTTEYDSATAAGVASSLVVSILIGIFVVLYTAIGQGIFYRDAKAEVDAGGSAA